MANAYTPDRPEEAAISKESILIQLASQFRLAKRCLPILWRRLVFPAIQARMEQKPIPHIHCTQQILDMDLQSVLANDSRRQAMIDMLRRYDYLRLDGDGHYTAGTRLWTEVDAERMMAIVNAKVNNLDQ